MKSFFLLALTSLSAASFASPQVLLERIEGGLDELDGVRKISTCQILSNSKKIDVNKVHSLILDASVEPERSALHIVRQVPSEEVYAYRAVRTAGGPARTLLSYKRVLLVRDSSDRLSRDGKASSDLLKMVYDNCK